ncbi:phage tail tip lysozyme [Duganella sp. CT11-25]|jgi:hypothetical protein|uniref:phage tail tip lysozyme n=1 Tax=unclassified Duganella TaxID=2636909 RepID=UPI0039AF8DE7
MSTEIGRIGTVYHCGIDGNTYKITSDHTAVRVTDPGEIQDGNHTFISNWRDFHVEGEPETVPAGANPPPAGKTSGTPPAAGSGTQFTAEELIQHFMSKGYTRAGAIGIVANLQAENGLKTTGAPASQGEQGLAQWKGQRLANLQAYAAAHNLDWQSKSAQLGYLDQELENDYPQVAAKLKNATDPQQAAQDFCAGFEMPTMDDGTPNYATYDVRKQIAREMAAGQF